jgi:hypothetical protein
MTTNLCWPSGGWVRIGVNHTYERVVKGITGHAKGGQHTLEGVHGGRRLRAEGEKEQSWRDWGSPIYPRADLASGAD